MKHPDETATTHGRARAFRERGPMPPNCPRCRGRWYPAVPTRRLCGPCRDHVQTLVYGGPPDAIAPGESLPDSRDAGPDLRAAAGLSSTSERNGTAAK